MVPQDERSRPGTISLGLARVRSRSADPRPSDRLIDAYYRRITSDNPSEREAAACAWCAWEDAHVSLNPHWQPNTAFEDPAYRQVFATLVIHYWKHATFLPDAAILEGMGRLREIRGHFIHGRLDISGPAETAWRLHRAWPGSTLTIVDDERHGGPKMVDELVRAIATWA